MNIGTASIYWVIVALWLTVLVTIAVLYARNPQTFGTTRLLLAVLAIDTFRNIIENIYFGAYFGSQLGLFAPQIAKTLGMPALLLLPKLLNVFAGCLVLSLLLLRWLPLAIKERRTVEQNKVAAEETARLKDEFTATVSHELRTPLTAITASLSLLEDIETPLPAEAKELVAIAHSNSRRLHRLVNDILDIEKLEAGKIVFEIQKISVRDLLRQEIDSNGPTAERHGVVLRLDASQSVEAWSDPHRLRQVVSNLLSNAIKFSPRGSHVVVNAVSDAAEVRISVRDHGPGIPEEFRNRIFQKFAQADMSDARAKGGSGLGLSIVKEIAERLDGSIGFADAPGGGSIFTLALPHRKAHQDEERGPISLQTRATAGQKARAA